MIDLPPRPAGRAAPRGLADVDDSALARALYSSDASLYRVVPQVVVRPRHADEILAVLDVARRTGVPLTMRGAGTSIAGNAVGPGIVVDTVRHLRQVLAIDPEARTAVVQPGVVHADLQRAAAPHGLRFGPDPSTHPRCTIGGMIGNNACGSRALGYGRTVDNVEALGSSSAPARSPTSAPRLDAGAGGAAGRRWATPTSGTSGPRSAGSAARSAATPWSTCCPSGAGSTASWSAPRAPSALVAGGHRARWCPRRPSGCWWCSATPRWPRPPTPCPRCSPPPRAG